MKKKLLSLVLLFCLFFNISISAYAATYNDILTASVQTADKFSQSDFSFGDEWLIIALSRNGNLSSEQAQSYLNDLAQHLKQTNGVLSTNKYTEYSRTILALSALGIDAQNFHGYNLLLPLADFEKVCYQGINGPIFALLALDSRNYSLPQNTSSSGQATRELYLEYILSAQTPDGGWNLAADPQKSANTDLTAMALQALSKYQNRSDVTTATQKALTYLAKNQDKSGAYSSDGIINAESTAQVIIALCELNLNPQEYFTTTNEANMVDALLSFNTKDGFKHRLNNQTVDALATEQSLCALAALNRYANHSSSLYRMTDTVNVSASSNSNTTHPDITIAPTMQAIAFKDTASSPYQKAISALAARGMISGRGNGYFYPNDTITRAEFAAILVKTLGLSEKSSLPFTDIKNSDWYYSALASAYNYQLIAGTSTTTFSPTGALTRQEAAVLISRAAKMCGLDTAYSEHEITNILCVYNDYRTCAAWSREALAWAYDEHILDDSVWEINPTENISRGEVVQMLYNMLTLAELI